MVTQNHKKTRQNLNSAGSKSAAASLSVSVAVAGSRDALAPQGFALLAAPVFARFFVTFLQLQPFKKAVILNLFFQNAHGLLKVIVKNLNLDSLQIVSPLSFHRMQNSGTILQTFVMVILIY